MNRGLHVPNQLHKVASKAKTLAYRAMSTAGPRQPEPKISADAQQYWNDTSGARWSSDSHWRGASLFAGTDLWSDIGRRHLDMFDRGVRFVGREPRWDRVLEWGCGGGANAIHFAPRAREFIGVDVSPESLQECARQVADVCDTSFHEILVDVPSPESVFDELARPCDVFLCFYVFELIPSPAYGSRLLHIAHRLLGPDGLALIQIKYDEGRWRTRPRRRGYRSGLANMTTYTIPAFWQLATRSGFKPELVELVPKNELDERYAYFLLSRAT